MDIGKFCKKALGTALSLLILLSSIPSTSLSALAVDYNRGKSYVDFEASEYSFNEGDGEINVKVLRHGDGNEKVEVAFKVADFLSSYGDDYEVLGENGVPLEKTQGVKPDTTEFVEEANLTAEQLSSETATGSTQLSHENEVEFDFEDKLDISTGSSLLDARNQFFDVKPSTDNSIDENEVADTLEEFYSYFLSAEGATGSITFDVGETEKDLTIRIADDDVSKETRMFMIALIGTDSENTSIAPNASTYVTILDDEKTETVSFDLVDNKAVLTVDNPTESITIRRTSGLAYFSQVYVSTVTDTASKEDYSNLSHMEISFAPGEAEKEFDVSAYNFDVSSSFGIRLESQIGAEIGTHYINVDIEAQDDLIAHEDFVGVLEDSAVMLEAQSASVTLGTSDWTGEFWNLPGGITGSSPGDGFTRISSDWTEISQEDKNGYSMYYTNQKQNLIGVNSLTFRTRISHPDDEIDVFSQKFNTFFRTASSQSFDVGSYNTYKKVGTANWTDYKLELDNTPDYAYVKFSASPYAAGWHNVYSKMDWIRINYSKYSFEVNESLVNFDRNIYDFTQSPMAVYQTYYDGEVSRLFNPGAVTIKTSSGQNVNGFYANANKTVTITTSNTNLAEKDIYLKGVYFVSSDLDDHDVYNENTNKYATNKTHFVAADASGSVNIKLDTAFIAKLRDKGVVDDVRSDAQIKIYPLFETEMVEVSFGNTDWEKAGIRTGLFDTSNKASHLVNVIEAYNDGILNKGKDKSGYDVYSFEVPKNSVIRVESLVDSHTTPNGIMYNTGSGTIVTSYVEGDKIFSATSPNKYTLTEADANINRGEFVATSDCWVRPSTGEQSFDIRNYPNQINLPDVYLDENGHIDLTGAVLSAEDLDSDIDEFEFVSDKNGSISFENPYLGMEWSILVNAPVDYFVQWVDMTGDTNNDGYITAEEQIGLSINRSKYHQVYGNRLSGVMDKNNLILDYVFIKPFTETGVSAKGVVTQEDYSFYELANNIKSDLPTKPVAGAYVNVAGFVGQTDINGRYDIALDSLPSIGYVSTSIFLPDNSTYDTIISLEMYNSVKIASFPKFEASSINANYAQNDSVSENLVLVEDDNLTIIVNTEKINDLVPSGAKFFVYDENGLELFDCSTKDGYDIKGFPTSSGYRAELTFNPKKDFNTGYQVYAQFKDQNGEWSSKINLGYDFVAPVNLDEFIFPLIGSSSFEDFSRTDSLLSVISSPLGDMSIGEISGFEVSTENYTPANIAEQDIDEYTWAKTNYSYGWSSKFYNKTVIESATSEAELKNQVDNVQGKAPNNANSAFSTKSTFKWSVTPEVGFNLTLSNRKVGDEYKTYFEDLVFFVKADFGASASISISLPIGINVIITGALYGDVAGIYHMFVDYQDRYETEDAIEYTSDDFGVFKKMKDSVRREGYIFLDPTIDISVGLGVGIVAVSIASGFNFNMDFHFEEDKNNAYGEMTYFVDWKIDVMSYTVFRENIASKTQHLFNSENQNGPIEFDTQQIQEYTLQSAADELDMTGEEELIIDETVSRDYLENRSEWAGVYSTYSNNSVQGSTEINLLNGTTDNPNVQMQKFGNDNIIMVFIDDVAQRSEVNSRALFYSVSNDGGVTWSTPVLVDDDGTLDDYPTLSVVGDEILVGWSSADKVLEDSATLEDALKSLNIKVALFDTINSSMGEPQQITKTTMQDYTADLFPYAAYDTDTNMTILYYTKTEYTDLEKLTDLSTAESVNAYMFYDGANWTDGDDYTADELSGMTEQEIASYKENWYGQRFLDLRLDASSNVFPRVVDTDAIYYNGLSLFTWTVDWDNNLETLNDRDVFMQIYNFSENSFTHVIRVTSNASSYTLPQFERSNNSTYLFYGEKAAEEDLGKIKQLNVSDLIKNDNYRKETQGDNSYYVFEKTYSVQPPESENGVIPEVETITLPVEASTAVVSENISEFDVAVNDDGKMYLVWTSSSGSEREISVSSYISTDIIYDENNPNSNDSPEAWSNPVVITDATDYDYYVGLGAEILGDDIIVGSVKANFKDATSNLLNVIKHEPISDVNVVEVKVENENPLEGSVVLLSATVFNSGLKKAEYSDATPLTVAFELNGEVIGTGNISSPIFGGFAQNAYLSVEIPSDEEEFIFKAYITKGHNEAELTLEKEADIFLVDSNLSNIEDDLSGNVEQFYFANIENTGNGDLDTLDIKAYVGETEVGTYTINDLLANSTQEVGISLNIPDELYSIYDDRGTAEVVINAISNDEVYASFTGVINKYFNSDAIELLKKLQSFSFENNGEFNMQSGDILNIQPEFAGVDEGELKIEWRTEDNENIAYINHYNEIVAYKNGTTVISGYVVPNINEIVINADGTSENVVVSDTIPDNQLKVASVSVTVTGADEDAPETPKVNVSVSGNGSAGSKFSIENDEFDKLFTSEELAKPEEKSLELVIDRIETMSDSEKLLVNDYINNSKVELDVVQAFDINLFKFIGDDRIELTNLTKPISITIEIPENLRGVNTNFVMLHVHEGSVELIEDLDDDINTFTFLTSKLSTFALAIRGEAKEDNIIETGDNSNNNLWWIALTFSFLAIVFILSKKKFSKV